MDRICLTLNPQATESCVELDFVQSTPDRDFSRLVQSIPENEGSLIHSHYAASGSIVHDLYRVRSGSSFRTRDFAAMAGGQAPYLWRHIPVQALRLDARVLENNSSLCQEFHDFVWITSDGDVYGLPAFNQAEHFFHLNDNGPLSGLKFLYGMTDSIVGQLRREEGFQAMIHERADARMDASTETPDASENLPSNQPVGALCQGIAAEEQQQDLRRVYEVLNVLPHTRLPLVYDPMGNTELGSFAYYNAAPAFLTADPNEGAFIAIGNEFLGFDFEARQDILAHEMGHHRYRSEVRVTMSQFLFEQSLQAFLRGPDPVPNRGVLAAWLEGRFIVRGDHLSSAESEIYADIVGLEAAYRRNGGFSRDSEVNLLQHMSDHLDRLQAELPSLLASLALFDSISLFTSDPLLSLETQRLACSIFQRSISSELAAVTRALHRIFSSQTAVQASGARVFHCME